MSFRDSFYFVLMEVHNGRPISVKTCFKGQHGDLTDLSRTVCRCQRQPDGTLAPEYGFDSEKNANCFTDSMTPRERLIILGGGHIAVPLCEFAARCDFAVTVVDDRMDFANESRFPLAQQVTCDSFENAIEKLRITAYDFVVVITRGHRHDANCLRALFKQREPAYLGMIEIGRAVQQGTFGDAEGGGTGRGASGENLYPDRACHRRCVSGGDCRFHSLSGD